MHFSCLRPTCAALVLLLASAACSSDSTAPPNPTVSMTPAANMTAERVLHTSTLLQSGKVLIAEGVDISTWPVTAERYDPTSGTFASTGTMVTIHHTHTAALLKSGKVLFAEGKAAPGVLATVELYDPATGRFASTAAMSSPRESFAASLLADGQILLTGGGTGTIGYGPTTVLATADLFAWQ